MKDREPVRMPVAEVEKPEPTQFIREGIEGYARAMAGYSIGATPTPTPKDFATDGSFAKFLSGVEIEDPHFKNLSLSQDADVADATALTLAKAMASSEARPSEKKARERFGDKILSGVGEALSGIGGKRATQGALALSLMATACSSAINPPLVEPTPTEVPVATSTEIAPSPTEELENIVIVSQRLITAEEVFDAGGEELKQAYLDFQEEIKLKEGFENATFDAWGTEALATDGTPFVTPFFEVNDPEEGNFLSMVILLEAGGFRAITLEPLEVTVDGKTYLTLSLTKNAETLESLLTPEPIFWIPVSLAEWNALTQDQKETLSVMFNGLGGIVTEAEPLAGGRIAAIRAVMTPAAPPEPTPIQPTPTEASQERPPDLEVYEGQVQVWLNPEYSLGGLLKIPEDGAQKFTAVLNEMLSRSNVYDGMVGDSPEEVNSYLIQNNGLLPTNFRIPRPLSDSYEFVQFVNTNTHVDLKVPVELRLYWNNEFPEEKLNIGIWTSEPGYVGIAVEVKNDGGLLLHVITKRHSLYSEDPSALAYTLNQQLGWILWMYNYYNGSPSDFNAFNNAFNQVNSLSRNYISRIYGFLELK